MIMANELLTCIKTRRSIRRFTEEPVDASALDMLLEAAVWAPSGGNHQSWLFTGIQNENVIKNLNGVIRETILASDSPNILHMKANADKGEADYFYGGKTIVIASNISDYINAMADCSAGMQNMMLMAHAMGLGSCWINVLRRLTDEEPLRGYLAELGIARERVICGALVIGQPAIEPAAPERKENTIQIIR